MRRDVLPRLDSLTNRDGSFRFKVPEIRKIAVTVRPSPDEPAGPPSGVRPAARRLTGRARAILTTAAVAAIVVNAGVAWTYWQVTEAGTRLGGNGVPVEMAVPARSDLNVPPAPGGRGHLLVTLINNHDFPVRITSVTPGPGEVVADDEHRAAGCTDPVVELSRERFPVRWDVQKNTIGAFTIPDGLIRGIDGDKACEGAVFTIPVRATGAGHSS
jgi:hypothetical protein